MSLFSPSIDVLTLEETAIYLRLPIETIERQALRGQIPGRRTEDSWRFLKAALDEWLRNYSGREILLNQVGSMADDETLPQLRTAIYALRERPEEYLA
jgi:excisionase family DNA binding protein